MEIVAWPDLHDWSPFRTTDIPDSDKVQNDQAKS